MEFVCPATRPLPAGSDGDGDGEDDGEDDGDGHDHETNNY